jgi:hypothetical protein
VGAGCAWCIRLLLVLLSISQQNPLEAVLLMQSGRAGKMSNAIKKTRSDACAGQIPLPGFSGAEIAERDRGYSVHEVCEYGYWGWWQWGKAGGSYPPKPKKPIQVSLPSQGDDDGI